MEGFETLLGPRDEDERLRQEQGFAEVASLIEGAQTIVICAHTNPDGDALGSELALADLIGRRWPHAQITCLLADNNVCPRIYTFLPGTDSLVKPCDYDGSPDLFIAVDLSEAPRLNEARTVLERASRACVLDHHLCSFPLASAGVIRTSAAAAGIIILEFALWAGVEVSQSMAQNLLCALVTDTGRFQYQNTDPEAFGCASLLVCKGASPSEISLNVYQSFRVQYLHLKSAVMGRIKTFEGGLIAYSYATEADLKRTGADLAEADGLVDVVRSVAGSEVALFLKKVPGGLVRGNLRSKGDLDVSGVARLMGGGGHRAAAGFTYEGDIDEALSRVLPQLRKLVSASHPKDRS